MSNFFQLVSDLERYIAALKLVLTGNENDSTNVDGVVIDSIKQSIDNQFDRISAMVRGRVAFRTQAQMFADLNHDDGTVAEVWDDAANINGFYGKEGASGSGTWKRSSLDSTYQLGLQMTEVQQLLDTQTPQVEKIDGLESSIAQLENYQQQVSEQMFTSTGLQQYLAAEDDEIIPLYVDSENKVALAFDKHSGELVGVGIDRVNTSNSRYVPVVVDNDNQIALAVEKSSGQLLFDPHDSSISLGLNRFGVFNESIPGVSFAIVDENHKIAFAIDEYGNQIKTTNDRVKISAAKQHVDAEINHFLFTGQSLSVGAAGEPAISLDQPYNNLTFANGPRSYYDELGSFKLLVEDNNTAPDGNTNRGETVCSGAANYVTALLQSESAIHPQSSNYQILSSTAGHGGYRIDQLNKGTTWYNLAIAHVQSGFDLANSQGKSYAVQALGWIQGENDQFDGSKTYQAYYDDLVQLQKDVEQDVKSITNQVSPVPLITYQLGCYVRQGYRNITLAQLDAANNNDNIVLATPMYHLPYSDGVHLNNVGYKWLGHYFAKAYKKTAFDGEKWQPLKPKSVQQQGCIVLIDFDVPVPPLSLDTSTLPTTNDYGFSVEQNGELQTIERVEVVSATQVKLTLLNPISTGAKVRYALDHCAPELTHRYGGAGNLRDSDSRTWQHGLANYPLYNWCVMFELTI